MKLARLTCPSCRLPYESPVDRNAFVVPCPFCGQNNNIPPNSAPITGMCTTCGTPIDDHQFVGALEYACTGKV